jgi:hypothetical protein
LNANFELVKPMTCISLHGQACCLDTRIAIPTDGEVPCMLNLLGITCCMGGRCNCKCCRSLEALRVTTYHPLVINAEAQPVFQQPAQTGIYVK